MEQLENRMLQDYIDYTIDYDEYEERMNYEFDRECED